MIKEIEEFKKRLDDALISKGCVKYYPDNLKEEALALHEKSKISANLFCSILKIAPKTLREWKLFFNCEISKKKRKINENSKIKISNKQTRESVLAKKRIRNKERYEKLKAKEEQKLLNSIVPIKKEKDELADDIKVYISRSIDAAIPVVNTRGDIISKEMRDMQEDWLKKNKPKKYSGSGIIIED